MRGASGFFGSIMLFSCCKTSLFPAFSASILFFSLGFSFSLVILQLTSILTAKLMSTHFNNCFNMNSTLYVHFDFKKRMFYILPKLKVEFYRNFEKFKR